MKKLIIYEFKKLWNKVSILAIIGLIAMTVISLYLVYINPSITTVVNTKGGISRGIEGYKELKKGAKDLKGVMDQEYLDKLVKNYNNSEEKKLFDQDTHRIKYQSINYIINYAAFGSEMNNFTIDLDFDFLKSEEAFYEKYKETLKDENKESNDNMTEKQLNIINKKIENIKIPFNVGYNEGLSIFVQIYGNEYWLVLIVLGFALSTIFSKDSNNGIEELALASKFGRKKNMNAKVIAGNLFAFTVYTIYIATLFLVIGVVMSLEGWNNSIQAHWSNCFYNISFGTGIIIMLFMGLLGVIIIANLIMLISIKFTNSKISTGVAMLSVCGILKLTQTLNILQLGLNPIFFGARFTVSTIKEFESFYFFGDVPIPYSVIAIALTIIYMLIIKIFTVRAYKRYRLN